MTIVIHHHHQILIFVFGLMMSFDLRSLTPAVLREFNDNQEPVCGFQRVFRGSCVFSVSSRTEVASLRSMCDSGTEVASIRSTVSSVLEIIGRDTRVNCCCRACVLYWMSDQFSALCDNRVVAFGGVESEDADENSGETAGENAGENSGDASTAALEPLKSELKLEEEARPSAGLKRRATPKTRRNTRPRRADTSLHSIWNNSDDEWGF